MVSSPEQPLPKSDILDLISGTMAENRDFLTEYAYETYAEIADLMDDAIVRLTDIAGNQTSEEFTQRAMSVFSYQFLFPKSTAIYVNALAGSLPTCFMELRSILEALTRCYFADKCFGDSLFFMERLALLKPKVRSVSGLMRRLETKIGVDFSIVHLWETLSNDWVHTTGFAEKIVDQVTVGTGVPSWAVVIPGKYNEGDLASINELGESVSLVRRILSSVD
jgi:hypothetical protein